MVTEAFQLSLLKLEEQLGIRYFLNLGDGRHPIVHRLNVLLDLVLNRQILRTRSSGLVQGRECEPGTLLDLFLAFFNSLPSNRPQRFQLLLKLILAKLAIHGVTFLVSML